MLENSLNHYPGMKVYTTFLLCCTVFFLFADQNLLAPNLTQIADEFGMDAEERDEKLGGYVALGFFVIGGPVALLVGYFTDTINRSFLFAAVVAFGESACLATYWVRSFKELLICRVLTGVSIGGATPVIFSMFGDLYPGSKRVYVSMLVGIAANGGVGAGQLLAGFTGPSLGWRVPFILVAVPALLCAVMVLLTVSDPTRGGQEGVMRALRRHQTGEQEQEQEQTASGRKQQRRGYQATIGDDIMLPLSSHSIHIRPVNPDLLDEADTMESAVSRAMFKSQLKWSKWQPDAAYSAVSTENSDRAMDCDSPGNMEQTSTPLSVNTSIFTTVDEDKIGVTQEPQCIDYHPEIVVYPLQAAQATASVELSGMVASLSSHQATSTASSDRRLLLHASSMSASQGQGQGQSVPASSPASSQISEIPKYGGDGISSSRSNSNDSTNNNDNRKICGSSNNSDSSASNPLQELEYTERIDCQKVNYLFRTPSVVLVLAQGLPGCLPWGMIMVFLNDYLATDRGLSVEQATACLLTFGAGGMLGQLAGGFCGQMLYNKRPRLQCVFMGLSVILSVFPVLFILNMRPSGVLFFPMTFIAGFTSNINGPNIRSVLQNVCLPEVRGTAFATFTLTDDLGKGAGPALVVQIIKACGGAGHRREAFNIVVLFWLLCGLLILCLSFTVPHDEAAVQTSVCAAVLHQQQQPFTQLSTTAAAPNPPQSAESISTTGSFDRTHSPSRTPCFADHL